MFIVLYVPSHLYLPPPSLSLSLSLSHRSTAGNESCPQPQTSEHLAAIEIMKLKHIIILQNKIDLIRDTQARDQYQEILKFVQGQFYSMYIVHPSCPASSVLLCCCVSSKDNVSNVRMFVYMDFPLVRMTFVL